MPYLAPYPVPCRVLYPRWAAHERHGGTNAAWMRMCAICIHVDSCMWNRCICISMYRCGMDQWYSLVVQDSTTLPRVFQGENVSTDFFA